LFVEQVLGGAGVGAETHTGGRRGGGARPSPQWSSSLRRRPCAPPPHSLELDANTLQSFGQNSNL